MSPDRSARALVHRAEGLLGRSLTDGRSLVAAERRNQVLRCRLGDRTVIVKDASEVEVAAYRRLERTGMTPRVLDSGPGVIVLEDLVGESLETILVDPSRRDGERWLIELARALGVIHGATIELPGEAGAGPTRWATDALAGFRAVCRRLEVDDSFDDFEPGPMRSLIQGDVGPDNCVVTPDGLRLIDFELATIEHPLVDTAHYRLGFPCCGCSGRIPGPLLAAMDTAHRGGLVHNPEPGAAERSLALLIANRVTRYVEWEALEEDWLWGLVGFRQRLLALLSGFDEPEILPGFTDAVRRVERVLSTRWSDSPAELPEYPALVGVGAPDDD